MIIIIRISGMVEIPKRTNESLFHMRLRRKYSAVLLQGTEENLKLLGKVRNFTAYGNIDDSTLALLLEKRAVSLNEKKINAKEIIDQLKKKKLEDLNIKPFFRLHPPRKGIDSKHHFPKGVLGDNREKINDLVRRML